ncbi:MAG: 2-phospho-L-lactate transferase [Halioglobus sp.]|nr:2-phospho-L-lactate transferase [Halioglobus sp.]
MAAAMQRVLALSGGVGGAKLALGLTHESSAGALHVLVNCADDFEHLGLHISPDIDTLLYTLAGLSDPQQGWGVGGETFNALEALGRLGGETWFRLGDKDLATHLWRSVELGRGQTLSQVTAELAARLGITAHIHPMSDDPVRTRVHSSLGELPFQHYFVREACSPQVTGFDFDGIEAASANHEVMAMLAADAFSVIVICPSNPFVSIDPILQLPGMWQALASCSAPVVLVSPIVGGIAIKGPAAKMMSELGMPVTAQGVAGHYQRHYPGLVDHFVIDTSDGTLAADIERLELDVGVTATVMTTLQDKRRLARYVLDLVNS